MNLIDGSTMILQHSPAPWDELVRLSAAMLERKGVTKPEYVDGIFDSITKNGGYMLIAPRVLLAHTRPEMGAIGTGMSLVTTTEDVPFAGEGKPTRLFFTLAASDSDAHRTGIPLAGSSVAAGPAAGTAGRCSGGCWAG